MSDIKKKNAKKRKNQERYAKNVSSDDDDWVSDDEYSDEEKLDSHEYQKILMNLFPSKYMLDKVEKNSSNNAKTVNRKKQKGGKGASKKKQNKKAEKSEDEEIQSEYSDEDEYDSDSDMEEYSDSKQDRNVNIIFTIGAPDYDEEYDSEYSEYSDSEYSYEGSDIESDDGHVIETRSSKRSKKKGMYVCENDCGYEGNYSDCETHEKTCKHKNSRKKSKNSSSSKKGIDDESYSDDSDEDADGKMTDEEAISKFTAMIDGLSEKDKKNKFVQKMLDDFKERKTQHLAKKKKNEKKEKQVQTKEFRKLLREKNAMNDIKYFKDKMTKSQQRVVIDQIKAIKSHCEIDKPYRLALLDSDIPIPYKACAYRKINTLKYMEPGGGEYYKIKNWVDTFMQIPFGTHKKLPITIDDGVEKCHEFMENAKNILDEAAYGLNDAKEQIMQMVGTWIANPNAIGTAIAIKGPMGTGKTTLVKEGISKILGRDFAFIALGGATDSSFLEGHSYTYEGSTWGKIVDILIKCKSMNPVFYFDELDKVSDTPKGEEITGILTHLTDTTQNSKFHDKYFSEIDFDLSRCLFIFSYNDESRINPILRDRMYRIHTKGYDKKEKATISNNYLLPKIQDQVKFSNSDIIIPDETIHHIIENHTDKEDGVRNLKRCLEIIHTKLNMYRLMKPGTQLFEKDSTLKVEFPMTVTVDIIDKILKKTSESGPWKHMYM